MGWVHGENQVTESQIVAALEEGEAGVPIADLLRKYGISRKNWKSRYSGATVPDLMRELEAENARLKRMYIELALENAAIKDLLQGKRQRRPRSERPHPRW